MVPHEASMEMVAAAGYEFAILDLEHGAMGITEAARMIAAGNGRGLHVLVRVPQADPWIGQVLDAGADGVVVPSIDGVEPARKIVRHARFAPRGDRGLSAYVRAADYFATLRTEFVARSNERVLAAGMVEGPHGLGQFDAIAAVDGLDVLFIGPMDLSLALGHGGDPEHPAVVETVVRLRERVSERGPAMAIWAPDATAAARWIDLGIEFVAVGTDVGHMLAGLRAPLAALARPTS
ncbi:HpcH/HpaI aldolase family protein [Microbacterium sp. CPCC 204701]|uniref:HpcH/HpaI aldolase family protein n=1 Tax=Microbacterium sp. CPCC 204701 TaxID=2493084 RepID=UPI001F0C346D|nr:aldolase/citrate lyase family protein [Microbacterium sp. CPCC 204701]